jgi:hypothetical protein
MGGRLAKQTRPQEERFAGLITIAPPFLRQGKPEDAALKTAALHLSLQGRRPLTDAVPANKGGRV